ncbi:MAG: PTS sugar transporter subunit IIC [Solobacterium sp.]|nr:PTS sugar transporter subunit IIC [Solobacterium sp.]
MDGFIEKLQNVLVPFSQKVNNSKILKGISGGFSAMLPVVMVGAIFTLLASLNIGPYQSFITAIGLKPLLAIPQDFTTNMISVYAVFLIAKAEASVLGMDERDSLASGVMALMAFLIMIPLGVTGTDAETGVVVNVAAAVNTTFLGSAGLFTAMIVGILFPYIHNFFITKNIGIKMPESVPPMISKSFSALIPALAIAFIAVILRTLAGMTSYGSVTMLIYGLLKAPLTALAASPLTFILLLIICNILWFFGIHGGMVATSIMAALYTELTLENLAAYGAGQALPNIIIQPAWFAMGNIGGSGCAMGLCLCLALFSRSARYKALNKISLPAGLCGISEPMVFGFPLVLNPVMLIPMIVAPIATFLLGYAAMAVGLVPYMVGVNVSTGTPVLLSAFAAWADWRGIVLQAVLVAVSVAIYYPFFRACDNQALKEEQEAPAEA